MAKEKEKEQIELTFSFKVSKLGAPPMLPTKVAILIDDDEDEDLNYEKKVALTKKLSDGLPTWSGSIKSNDVEVVEVKVDYRIPEKSEYKLSIKNGKDEIFSKSVKTKHGRETRYLPVQTKKATAE